MGAGSTSIAKIWLHPEIAVAESYGFSSAELKELVGIVEENSVLIERAWDEHFG